jgi:hypothetical protein
MGQKPDVELALVDVRYSPKSGHRSARWRCPLCAISGQSASQQNSVLFDYLIGATEQWQWDLDAERFSSLEIDEQFHFG